jgi:hypothetical protein
MLRFLLRLSVVLICYALCSYGFIGVFFALSSSSLIGAMMFLALLGAWTAHIWMSLGWIVNRKVPPHIPIFGTLIAIFALLVYPFAAGLGDQGIAQMLKNLVAGWAMGVILFCPCIALAVYLCRFHLRHETILHIAPNES